MATRASLGRNSNTHTKRVEETSDNVMAAHNSDGIYEKQAAGTMKKQ